MAYYSFIYVGSLLPHFLPHRLPLDASSLHADLSGMPRGLVCAMEAGDSPNRSSRNPSIASLRFLPSLRLCQLSTDCKGYISFVISCHCNKAAGTHSGAFRAAVNCTELYFSQGHP